MTRLTLADSLVEQGVRLLLDAGGSDDKWKRTDKQLLRTTYAFESELYIYVSRGMSLASLLVPQSK